MYLPVSPIFTLPHSQGILYISQSYFSGYTGSVSHTKCDLSVASDLKTDRTPCCCKQRLSVSDKPLMYGRTAVDLISVVGSLSDACRFFDFVMSVTNEQTSRFLSFFKKRLFNCVFNE